MEWKSDTSAAPTGKPPSVPASVVDRKTLGEWLVETCCSFGSSRSTGHKVAGQFMEQLEKDERKPQQAGGRK